MMETEKGKFTHQEIISQPKAWATGLDVITMLRQPILNFNPRLNFDQIVFTGCGSTYYLSLAAAALTQELTGIYCRALPASELWLYPHSSYGPGRTLLIATSRSGETTETLKACQNFVDEKRGTLITLSCYGDMPLAGMGALNIVLPSGQEQSVAQTRAFSTLYLAAIALACLWSEHGELTDSLSLLPEAGQKVLEQAIATAAGLGANLSLDRFYWLGSGPRYGLASELSLKMKEMSLSHSEPFHFMEFRHGPKSMVTPSTAIVGLLSSVQGIQERAVLAESAKLGGFVLDIGETNSQIHFESGLDEAIRNILYLPVGQLIAFERSLAKGLDPDLPTNLESVVKL